MNTKVMKILAMVATILLVISIGVSTVFAASIISPSDVENSITPPTGTDIQDLGGKIIGILQTVGVVLAVVIVAILGIKYMMGSAEEKADYKKSMIPYIVGAACIFLAPQIANIVYQFFKG